MASRPEPGPGSVPLVPRSRSPSSDASYYCTLSPRATDRVAVIAGSAVGASGQRCNRLTAGPVAVSGASIKDDNSFIANFKQPMLGSSAAVPDCGPIDSVSISGPTCASPRLAANSDLSHMGLVSPSALDYFFWPGDSFSCFYPTTCERLSFEICFSYYPFVSGSALLDTLGNNHVSSPSKIAKTDKTLENEQAFAKLALSIKGGNSHQATKPKLGDSWSYARPVCDSPAVGSSSSSLVPGFSPAEFARGRGAWDKGQCVVSTRLPAPPGSPRAPGALRCRPAPAVRTARAASWWRHRRGQIPW